MYSRSDDRRVSKHEATMSLRFYGACRLPTAVLQFTITHGSKPSLQTTRYYYGWPRRPPLTSAQARGPGLRAVLSWLCISVHTQPHGERYATWDMVLRVLSLARATRTRRLRLQGRAGCRPQDALRAAPLRAPIGFQRGGRRRWPGLGYAVRPCRHRCRMAIVPSEADVAVAF